MSASPIFIFQSSSSTCLDCVEKNLFGSNTPWPLQSKTGDYSLRQHYKIDPAAGRFDNWPDEDTADDPVQSLHGQVK
jgi:hypothetical protein